MSVRTVGGSIAQPTARSGIIAKVSVSWGRARRIAASVADARPGVLIALRDAVGLVLAEGVTARTALPAWDEATGAGWAVSGPGPWTIESAVGARLPDGAAWAVAANGPLPAGADAVVTADIGLVRAGADATWLYVRDPGAREPSTRPGYVSPGASIRPRGQDCAAGALLVVSGVQITPPIVSLAAWAGADELVVIRPPDVVVVTIGDDRLIRGPARDGRVRDPVGPALPGVLGRAGARALPEVHVAGAAGALRARLRDIVDDVAADLVILTGPTGPSAHADAAGALADIGASVLVADVCIHPGPDVFLAQLRDGRLVAYVPGEPLAAVAALVTVVTPVLHAMAGRGERAPEFALLDRGEAGHGEDTSLVPALRRRGEIADTVATFPAGIQGLARSDCLAVLPPDGAETGTLVELIDLP